jgi:hypothetical protein
MRPLVFVDMYIPSTFTALQVARQRRILGQPHKIYLDSHPTPTTQTSMLIPGGGVGEQSPG